jgi:hypothetical protein
LNIGIAVGCLDVNQGITVLDTIAQDVTTQCGITRYCQVASDAQSAVVENTNVGHATDIERNVTT